MSSLLQSTLNIRALPTGDLRYIRSDYPGNLTPSEIRWLVENNITTVIDLREEKEYLIHPCILESMPGFVFYHLPVTGGGNTPKSAEAVASVYLSMLDDQMDTIIDTILTAKTNVLYFCGAGKDRTGVVSAVLLKRLGFSHQQFIQDYMESKANLMDFLTSYVRTHPQNRYQHPHSSGWKYPESPVFSGSADNKVKPIIRPAFSVLFRFWKCEFYLEQIPIHN